MICATKEMACRSIRQSCIISLVSCVDDLRAMMAGAE